MRPRSLVLASALTLLAAIPAVPAESTRTLKLEHTPTGAFAVENLAGSMRVVSGTGDKVVAVATVHAESDDLAASMKFEMVRGEKGVPTLRLRYPLDEHSTIRYPGSKSTAEGEGHHSFWNLFGGGSNSTTTYDGERVKVSTSSGALLYADVEVQVPRGSEGALRNFVGRIDARDVEGKLLFDSASGDITIQNARGEIKGDTGSGDVKAEQVEGSFSCDTGSGDCDVEGIHGDRIDCDTGSGEIRITDSSAERVSADTGSGGIKVVNVDAGELVADTGSGDIVFEARDGRLTRVKADTGSGDVTLRLPADASFEARADQGSGELVSRFRDAQPIVQKKEVVGYRRGDGRIQISIDTGSGDVTIEPGR